jgi:hypothetical protein
MKISCACGNTLTRDNSRYVGVMDGADDTFDLELYDCSGCGSCRALKIYREHGIIELEMQLKRQGFFQEADTLGRKLRSDRMNSMIVRRGR